ncbi:hypothetical protein FPANT_5084 [Fusarium pseudoanthophilum]|uniref:Uncharacterized protein n=1 Tax=Fusarium pseudoanthophilum TaxID=48495 RepID=A0A8H5UPJ5_9HYPO|nr:hypothetical protein FPANT_5084 [Fusarium pseudoanthophilum]
MSTKFNFLNFALELRLHIYRDYFQLDGGYVYDAKSDKLKTSDNQPIDLSLMFTCRTIANETRHLPLSVNTITFSTLYREDWRSLAGCFNVVTSYYRHLQADLVLHLAEFMTPEMYGQIALEYPNFSNQLEALSRHHRLRWLVHNNRRVNEVMAAESGSADERTRDEVERLKGMRCCMSLQGFLNNYVNSVVFDQGPDQSYAGFSRIHHSRDLDSRRSEFGPGSDSEIVDAMSYCLRLIADKKPLQFANHLRAMFPQWTGPDIVQSFLRLRFDSWAIPSEKEVKNAISLLDIDGIWEFPDRWHSKRPPLSEADMAQRLGESFDNSDDDQDDDQDDEDDEENGEDDEEDDDDEDDDICDPDTNVYNHDGLQCREKIRFSAAANAIRFLKRIPGQRIHLKHLVLHEDFDSVNDPHTHARGLAPFVKENPSLHIVRRVSMVDCIIGLSYYVKPSTAVGCLQRSGGIKVEPKQIKGCLPHNISFWIKDALDVKDVGIPAKSFTLRLEAGRHRDFCTDLFQRIVHREIAWSRAYKLLNARGIFHHRELTPCVLYDGWMLCDDEVEAIDKLVNQTSGVLSADFNTGVALDAQALAKETEHLDGYHWVAKWHLWGRSLKRELPPPLSYDKLADIFEFRTDDGQLVANPQST